MRNPILDQMGNRNSANGILQMLKGNPAGAVETLMQRSPQFRTFCEQNKGKSVDEICSSYGIDKRAVESILKNL